MIVTTRQGIIPLCDKHRTPTRISRYEGGSFGMNAFGCTESGCTRAYNTSSGYFDVVDGRILLQKEQQLCPEDGTAMFLESVSPPKSVELWRCGQINCNAAFALQKL
jgi:hypothetical protein